MSSRMVGRTSRKVRILVLDSSQQGKCGLIIVEQRTLSFAFFRRFFAGLLGTVFSVTVSSGSWVLRHDSNGSSSWVVFLALRRGKEFMVTLSALPEVVTRVFNNLAYLVSTFEGPSSSESGTATV